VVGPKHLDRAVGAGTLGVGDQGLAALFPHGCSAVARAAAVGAHARQHRGGGGGVNGGGHPVKGGPRDDLKAETALQDTRHDERSGGLVGSPPVRAEALLEATLNYELGHARDGDSNEGRKGDGSKSPLTALALAGHDAAAGAGLGPESR